MMLIGEALQKVAALPIILVASDYDGTLAPIVGDPDRAFADQRALAALVSLGACPDTHAAILSGRSLDALRRLTGDPTGVELIGGHGAEHSGRVPDTPLDAREQLEGIMVRLAELTLRFDGSRIEEKALGVAFHYRNVRSVDQPPARAEVRRLGLGFPALTILEGKKVVEFTTSQTGKGHALRVLREDRRVDAVVFLGDDATDEDGFASLRPVDVGIKVGAGATRARFRLRDQTHVADTLESLLLFR